MRKINLNGKKNPSLIKIKDSKFIRFCNKLKDFIIREDDYMIFLIMLLLTSFLLGPYGVTRTIPLVIIVPFLLGIFYKGRKRIITHTMIGLVILASVSQDIHAASMAIIVTAVCVFSGSFVSMYVEKLKKLNIFRKIIYGVFSIFLVFISLYLYSFRYGTTLDYFKTNKAVSDYLQSKGVDNYFVGTTYNADEGYYEVHYVLKEDLKTEIVYKYDAFKNEMILNQENLITDSEEQMEEQIEK